jgi:hypothetical protein
MERREFVKTVGAGIAMMPFPALANLKPVNDIVYDVRIRCRDDEFVRMRFYSPEEIIRIPQDLEAKSVNFKVSAITSSVDEKRLFMVEDVYYKEYELLDSCETPLREHELFVKNKDIVDYCIKRFRREA